MKKNITAKEISIVISDLSLDGSILSDIRQNSFDSLTLTFFKKNVGSVFLFVRFSPYSCLYEIANKKPSCEKLERFIQFSRANITPSKVLSVLCVKNEREVCLKLSHLGKILNLYIRLFSASKANLVVCDDNDTILEAFYRRPKQQIIKGQLYRKSKGFDTDDFGARERDYSFRSFSEQLQKYYEEEESSTTILDYEKLLFNNEYNKRLNNLEQAVNKIGLAILSNDSKRSVYESEILNFDYIKRNPSEINDLYNELKELKLKLQSCNERLNKFFSEKAELQKLLDQVNSSENLSFVKENLKVLKSKNSDSNKQVKETRPYCSFKESKFIDIFVGRNAKENDYILRNVAKGNDLFLHIRDFPGSYVIIRSQKNKGLTKDALLDAAELLLFYSKRHKEGNIFKTQIKYVKRISGAKLGTVEILRDENFFYQSSEERLKSILSRMQ